MNRAKVFIIALVASALLAGCSNMSSTQQRVLSGGAMGAGAGAAIGVIAGGGVLAGTAIGAGAGAVGGLIYDEMKKKK